MVSAWPVRATRLRRGVSRQISRQLWPQKRSATRVSQEREPADQDVSAAAVPEPVENGSQQLGELFARLGPGS